MKKLTIFANFLINDEERFLRMKDSFKSFEKAKIDCWVINIRGSYKKKTYTFLKKNIHKNKLKIFLLTDSVWMESTKKMLKYIKTKLVFVWVEDHICLTNHKFFNLIINDMIKYNIEYLQYSWYLHGLTIKSTRDINYKSTKRIIYFNYTKEKLKKRLRWFKLSKKRNQLDYIISMQSILTLALFKKIILTKEFSFFNSNNPFSFEKNINQIQWLPYKCGIVKKEFFCSIDDDELNKNYSLISRGLYPKRKNRTDMIVIRKNENGSIYNLLGRIYFSSFLEFFKSPIKKILRY